MNNQRPKRWYEKIYFFRSISFWLTYFISKYETSYKEIPENIGNKLSLGSNSYMTKDYITSMIEIVNLGVNSPIQLMSKLTRIVRKAGNHCIIDYSIKNVEYDPNLFSSTVKSRKAAWEAVLNNEEMGAMIKREASIGLYTYQKASQGAILNKSVVTISIRGKTGDEIDNALKLIKAYLIDCGVIYHHVTSGILDSVKYTTFMNNSNLAVKNLPYIITSASTCAQIIPNNSAYVDTQGVYVGINCHNNQPVIMDLSKVTLSRNFLILSLSGGGKTVIAVNMIASVIENGNRLVVKDIKGNEYTTLVKAAGGMIIDLTLGSTSYVNTWKLPSSIPEGENPLAVYNRQVEMSLVSIYTLAMLNEEEQVEIQPTLTKFIEGLYTTYGVVKTNPNTWVNSEELNPFVAYKSLYPYLVSSKDNAKICRTIVSNLDQFWKKDAPSSYLFQEEFDTEAMLQSPALSLSFGLLVNSNLSIRDMAVFKLKFLFSSYLTDRYIAYNYKNGYRTANVMEEAQVVDDDLIKVYIKDWTTRRSQMVDNFFIANSLIALKDRGALGAVIENTSACLASRLSPEAIDILVKGFDAEYLKDNVQEIASDTDRYDRAFILMDKMGIANKLNPIVKVQLDETKPNSIFKPNKEVFKV